MATIKNKADFPDYAKAKAELAEKFGFRVEFAYDDPLPEKGKRVQIREDDDYAPAEMVSQIRQALRLGDPVPPIVRTRDGYVVDGNTTTEACAQNGFPTFHALILDRNWEGPDNAQTRQNQIRIRGLGIKYNMVHGKKTSREAVRAYVEAVGPDGVIEAKRLAEMIGEKESWIQSVWAQVRAKQRMDRLNITPNGLNDSQLKVLGQVKLNDRPYRELVRLTTDANLTPIDQRDVIRRAIAEQDDEGALRVIEEERERRVDQIADACFRGHARPYPPQQVNRHMGGICKYEDDPSAAVERNPKLVADYIAAIDRTISVLQKIRYLCPSVEAQNAE